MSPLVQEQFLLELYRRSFYHFYWKCFVELKGQQPKMAPYVAVLAHALTAVFHGDTPQLAVSMPPRCGKSLMCSTVYPAWVLGHQPTTKFMVLSYGQELARELGEGTRALMQMPFYQRIFPDARIALGSNTQTLIRLDQGGERRAVSFGGAGTGLGTNYLIIDDPHKADEALTPAGQERVVASYLNTFSTRFDDPSEGKTIITHQRLHEADLTGQVLTRGNWEHLCFPAVAEMDERFALPGGEEWYRRKGDLLHPLRLPLVYLEQQRLLMGPRRYNAQFQQNPISAEGSQIRLEWFGQYDEMPPRRAFQRIVQSCDTASSERVTADYSVGMTFGLLDGDWYILDVVRGRWAYTELRDRIFSAHRRWKADALILENASTGASLFDEARNANLPGILRCPTPRGTKQDRVAARTTQLMDRSFLLPASAPWLPQLRHELVAFPDGAHDDHVDALTQFLEFIIDEERWVEQKFDPISGRPLRPSRPQRRSRYYDGDYPSVAH